MRNTVSQSEPMAGGIVLTVSLKSSSVTHTNWYFSVIAAIDRPISRDRELKLDLCRLSQGSASLYQLRMIR
jgi:hypothetical protein